MIIPNTWRNNKNVPVTTNQCSKHPASIPKFQPANIQHLRHSFWSITRSPVSLNQGDTRQGAYCERSGRPLESNILDLGQNLEIPWHQIWPRSIAVCPMAFPKLTQHWSRAWVKPKVNLGTQPILIHFQETISAWHWEQHKSEGGLCLRDVSISKIGISLKVLLECGWHTEFTREVPYVYIYIYYIYIIMSI